MTIRAIASLITIKALKIILTIRLFKTLKRKKPRPNNND
jgi:hypothetical protein